MEKHDVRKPADRDLAEPTYLPKRPHLRARDAKSPEGPAGVAVDVLEDSLQFLNDARDQCVARRNSAFSSHGRPGDFFALRRYGLDAIIC